jgi:hypothetical protein
LIIEFDYEELKHFPLSAFRFKLFKMNTVRKMNFLFLSLLLNIQCGSSDSDPVPSQPIGSKPAVEGVRIAWDYSTRRKLSPASSNYSGYARMIRLSSGKLFCVFENDGVIQSTQSDNDGDTWTTPVTIAVGPDGINAAVPEVLQLKNNTILVSYNLRPGGAPDVSKKFAIRLIRSDNDGASWTDPQNIYEAGYEFANGCWEPAQIQLPSGQVQMYIANEGPYTSSNEQEITMFRSDDNGVSWTSGEKVSFRGGYRDGMPVPLVLEDKNAIIMSIEDNGIIPAEFKPAIIRTTLTNSWSNAPVGGSSQYREQPYDEQNRIGGSKYAGAPYIRRLSSREVILSCQSNELRSQNIWDRSDLIVAIGNDEGKNFNRKSRPFYFTDQTKTALWNSLSVIDENTVVALASTNAYGNKTEVWMIKGYVLREEASPKQTITVDGENTENLWNTTRDVFIGGYGQASASLWTSWDDNNLYVLADVTDENVFSSGLLSGDGLRLYLDPTNCATVAPDTKVFSLGLSPSGTFTFEEGKSAAWEPRSTDGINFKSKSNASGYRMEVAIPWSALGGKPSANTRIGFNACLYESSNGSSHAYEEPIAGNTNGAPYTWSTLKLE